ncbi:MAG: serine hydrolase [uncultured Clostridium sp.]
MKLNIMNRKNNKLNLLKKYLLFYFLTILIAIFLIWTFYNNWNSIYFNTLEEIPTSISTSNSRSVSYFTSSSEELINKITTYKATIKTVELSEDELSCFSSLSYEERLNFLFNTSYSLSDRISVFLSSEIDNVGLVYYDLSSDETIKINEDLEFTAASTYKVGLNLLFYYLASQGEIDLNTYISYNSSDYEEGTGILYTYSSIDSYTIQELLDLSIVYSDNIATNMLGRYLGGHAIVREKLYDLLDIDFSAKGNYITANLEFKILKYIYKHKSDINFSHLIDILTKTEFHDRLDKYIPQEIVAHKVGSYDSYIHDVGIILDDSPYILVIYTYDLENAEEKIAQISKAIYETAN